VHAVVQQLTTTVLQGWLIWPLLLLLFVLLQVKGKCNAISIDKCKKTGVVFEDVIASCEMVNCNSIQVNSTLGCSNLHCSCLQPLAVTASPW
jgi:hypothetical protein